MDISTTYLKMALTNPFIVGASPLTEQVDTAQALEASGAAALVMQSLYEERMHDKPTELPYYEKLLTQAAAAGALPHNFRSPLEPMHYLERLSHIKRKVAIPVIASISCTSLGDWIEYARLIETAGADALELNIFLVAASPSLSSGDLEKRVVDIVASIRQRVKLPLAVKLSPFYTSLPHLVEELTRAGADGLVLFTRSYQPDINVETREVSPDLHLSAFSDQTELRLRLRWMALLSPWTRLSLSVTGGIHTGLDAAKAIMAGAHCVEVVSCLLNAGPAYLESLLEQFQTQMQKGGFASVAEMRGCMNHASSINPAERERASYVTAMHSWTGR
jgi:dihydroorotate dehydrogenase (fumarate)